MKLIENNGMVGYMMKAGNDYVAATMPVEDAKRIVAKGNMEVSRRFRDFPVCVDGQYYFAAQKVKPEKAEKPDSTD